MAMFLNIQEKPLVFVQHSVGSDFTVYQDGEEVRGIRSIRIDGGIDEFTTHEIEYLTGKTAPEPMEIEVSLPEVPPNVFRRQAIEKARDFVEEVTEAARSYRRTLEGNITYQEFVTVPEFVVNEDKRTVVALIKGAKFSKMYEKGIAKCNPEDVFNADLGKAIALGRAYGLDVSEFEQAPQPDEVVVGMHIRVYYADGGVGYFENKVEAIESVDSQYFRLDDGSYSSYEPTDGDRIISDSEAKY